MRDLDLTTALALYCELDGTAGTLDAVRIRLIAERIGRHIAGCAVDVADVFALSDARALTAALSRPAVVLHLRGDDGVDVCDLAARLTAAARELGPIWRAR